VLGKILREAKVYWHAEILGGPQKPFKWTRLRQKCKRNNRDLYLFWFRLAYAMHEHGNSFWRRRAKLLNEKVSRRFGVEIMLGAHIGLGLRINHPTAIVITSHARIGRDFRVWQNTSIGIKGAAEQVRIVLGDSVRLSAHSCIIGDDIEIGDNVVIGAGSLVTKSVPANHVFYNERTDVVREYDPARMGRLQQ
jgi:serine O-acetyltransferase